MKRNKLLYLSFLLLFTGSLISQDLHYSNYHFAPLYLNPAKTGGFNGNIRAGASYRDQFRTFIGEAYQSTMVWADSPIAFGINEQQWIGVGVNLFSDKTGDLGFGMSGVSGSVAYHISLDKKYDKVIAIGAQIGMISRRFGNPDNANFGDELQGGGAQSLDQNLINNFNQSFVDMAAGVTYKHRWYRNLLEVGASLYHFNKPQFFFNGSTTPNLVSSRLNVHGSINFVTSKRFQLKPGFVYSAMQEAQTFQLQLNSKTLIKPKGHTLLTAGLGYRFGDAIQFFLGAIHKSWEAGLSYDMTVSSASKYNNTVGGLELGVKKYFTIFKKPKVKVIKICPRV